MADEEKKEKNNKLRAGARAAADLFPEPAKSCKFWVLLQAFRLGFSKISNIEDSIETEAFQEGGVNNKTYSLMKPCTHERVLTLERGVANRGVVTEVLTSRFKAGNRILNDIFIVVLHNNNTIAKMYLLTGCTVKKWSISDLNANTSEVLIDRFEVAYESVEDFRLTNELIDGLGKTLGLVLRENVGDKMKKIVAPKEIVAGEHIKGLMLKDYGNPKEDTSNDESKADSSAKTNPITAKMRLLANYNAIRLKSNNEVKDMMSKLATHIKSNTKLEFAYSEQTKKLMTDGLKQELTKPAPKKNYKRKKLEFK